MSEDIEVSTGCDCDEGAGPVVFVGFADGERFGEGEELVVLDIIDKLLVLACGSK